MSVAVVEVSVSARAEAVRSGVKSQPPPRSVGVECSDVEHCRLTLT